MKRTSVFSIFAILVSSSSSADWRTGDMPGDVKRSVPTSDAEPRAALGVDSQDEARPLRGRRASEEECTPGYDPCIPPGPDVDCAGGRGNGPRYVEGPVYVTGSDPYDLDRDGDGVGCE